VFKICTSHINKIDEVVCNLKNLLDEFKSCNVDEVKKYFQIIFKLEREADDIKENIIRELSRGPFHPIDRDDIMRFILTADDIASYAKAAGRKLTYVDPKTVPDDIREDINKMGKMACDEMSHLKLALEYLMKNKNKSIEETNRVERLEEAIDEFREEMISKVLKWADKVDFVSHWLMTKEAIENIEMMSDSIEDTGDIIRGLAVNF
jgi:hypothetical protein